MRCLINELERPRLAGVDARCHPILARSQLKLALAVRLPGAFTALERSDYTYQEGIGWAALNRRTLKRESGNDYPGIRTEQS